MGTFLEWKIGCFEVGVVWAFKTKGSGTLRWQGERGAFPVRKVGVLRLGSFGPIKQRVLRPCTG